MHARSNIVVILLIIFFCPGPVLAKSELPNDFAEQVPLYPSAQPVDTRYTRDSVTVTFSTDDGYEQVSGFYSKALEETGWLILPVTTVGVIEGEKGDPGKNDIELSIKEVAAEEGYPSRFSINLYYPGGRE
jgi:hypothetical protein